MYCVWCDQEVILEVSWENIFFLTKPKSLCAPCEKELEVIQGKRCDTCSRSSTESICDDCKWWDSQGVFDDPIASSYSIFTYNDRMKEMIAKWKYRGDYFVATAFKDKFIESFTAKYSFLTDALIVPIPLSNERLIERGFNQAKLLADFLPLKSKEVLTRTHSEKQSKKTRHERISAKNPFSINGAINKQVILVDDIYTTGATIRHAGKLLKEYGCTEVYAYTLIRG